MSIRQRLDNCCQSVECNPCKQVRKPNYCSGSLERMRIVNQMRKMAEHDAWWSRNYIFSLDGNNSNERRAALRRVGGLTYEADDLTDKYFHHSELVTHLYKDYLQAEVETYNEIFAGGDYTAKRREWENKSDELCEALNCVNPYLKLDELKQMFDERIALSVTEAELINDANYAAEILLFDKLEQLELEIADYLSLGVIKEQWR